MNKKILCLSIFMALVLVLTPLLSVNTSALGDAFIMEDPTVSGISYGEPAGNAFAYGGIVKDSSSGENIYGNWEIVNKSEIPKNGDMVELRWVDTSYTYSDIYVTVPIQVEEADVSCSFDYRVFRSDMGDKLNADVSLSFTSYVTGEPIFFPGDCYVWYRLSYDDEWIDVTNGYMEIPYDEANSFVYVKVEYAGLEGCYRPFTTETSFIPEEYLSDSASAEAENIGEARSSMIVVVLVLVLAIIAIFVIAGVIIAILLILGAVAIGAILIAVVISLIVKHHKKKRGKIS